MPAKFHHQLPVPQHYEMYQINFRCFYLKIIILLFTLPRLKNNMHKNIIDADQSITVKSIFPTIKYCLFALNCIKDAIP